MRWEFVRECELTVTPAKAGVQEVALLLDFCFCVKVHLVITSKADIETAFYGFPLKLVPVSVRRGACGNDGLVTQLTSMFRCDHQVMTVLGSGERKQHGHSWTGFWRKLNFV